MARNDDYEVGYGKPPRHSQFKPGESGNPRGSEKGSRGLKADLNAVLKSKLTIQINGKKIKGTTQLLMLMTLATRAASGDVKATALLSRLTVEAFGFEDRGKDRTRLPPQDEALLDEILRDLGEPGNEEADNDPQN